MKEMISKAEVFEEIEKRAIRSNVAEEWVVTKTDVLRALDACKVH